MADFALRIEGLSKRYQLGQRRHDTARDALSHAARLSVAWLKGVARPHKRPVEAIWAVRDVSFEIQPGEVLGIVGRNGAGKSTLLRILARVTAPTGGRVLLNGRVGSLLEVGSGFHAELSGRENIFLNGAILGMKRDEIRSHFDEIVAFAEVEQFLDTPIKHYSSGMYMRLAFAVAAFLESEILLVDEALAVGDATFQRRCLGKMGDVAKEGRTVVFVSHNMAAVLGLCTSALLLESGRLRFHGSAGSVVQEYLSGLVEAPGLNNPASVLTSHRTRGSGAVRLVTLGIQDQTQAWRHEFRIWEPPVVVLEIENTEAMPRQANCWFSIVDSAGSVLGTSIHYDSCPNIPPIPANSRATITTIFEGVALAPGTYTVNAGILGRHREILDWCENVVAFSVLPVLADGTPYDNRVGVMPLRSRWGLPHVS
jgi:lipopolysaccharide transport system ATP-binding protein